MWREVQAALQAERCILPAIDGLAPPPCLKPSQAITGSTASWVGVGWPACISRTTSGTIAWSR
jgi:hypothetical protein